MTWHRAACLVCAGLLLNACSPVTTRMEEDPAARAAYEARARYLARIDNWAVRGRLAITDSEQGGSGMLTWERSGELSHMAFRGTLGQGSWQLDAGPSHARLLLADGRAFEAQSVTDLVHAHVGWKVPVDALSWWVRGLAYPSGIERRYLDAAGRLSLLHQSGWQVEFGGYREHADTWLPVRLTARRGDYTVKLMVRDWSLGVGSEGLE